MLFHRERCGYSREYSLPLSPPLSSIEICALAWPVADLFQVCLFYQWDRATHGNCYPKIKTRTPFSFFSVFSFDSLLFHWTLHAHSSLFLSLSLSLSLLIFYKQRPENLCLPRDLSPHSISLFFSLPGVVCYGRGRWIEPAEWWWESVDT